MLLFCLVFRNWAGVRHAIDLVLIIFEYNISRKLLEFEHELPGYGRTYSINSLMFNEESGITEVRAPVNTLIHHAVFCLQRAKENIKYHKHLHCIFTDILSK